MDFSQAMNVVGFFMSLVSFLWTLMQIYEKYAKKKRPRKSANKKRKSKKRR